MTTSMLPALLGYEELTEGRIRGDVVDSEERIRTAPDDAVAA